MNAAERTWCGAGAPPVKFGPSRSLCPVWRRSWPSIGHLDAASCASPTPLLAAKMTHATSGIATIRWRSEVIGQSVLLGRAARGDGAVLVAPLPACRDLRRVGIRAATIAVI